MNLNKAIIVGRITRDPETRSLPSGSTVANFSIATNRVWTDSNTKEKQEQTEFHNIVAFGRLGEICGQYLTKGSLICVEGRIQTRSWQDQSGNKRYRTEIVAENMQMGPRPASNMQDSRPRPQNTPPPQDDIPVIDQDEIPTTNEPKKTDGPEQTETEEGEINVKDIPF